MKTLRRLWDGACLFCYIVALAVLLICTLMVDLQNAVLNRCLAWLIASEYPERQVRRCPRF